MKPLAQAIDTLNEIVGRVVAWGVLAMVLFQMVVVVARYVFSTSDLFGFPSIWLQEGIVYLHGFTIMLGAAYALLYDGHVRVDILRARAGQPSQDWIDIIGSLLFVLPLCALIAWAAWPNLRMSWMTLEGSIEPYGLPFRYLLKSSILVFSILVALQALSIAIKAALRLAGRTEDPPFRDVV